MACSWFRPSSPWASRSTGPTRTERATPSRHERVSRPTCRNISRGSTSDEGHDCTSALLCLGALSGCASTSTSETDSTSESSQTTSQSESTSKEPEAFDCEPVPDALLAAIADGAEPGVGKLRLTEGAAVRAPGYKQVYLIAAEMKAPGVDGEQGVWASNSLKPGGGIIIAVDGFAQEFTVWPDGDSIASPVPNGTEGQDEVLDCLEA